jgi:hypothetical protein
VRWISTTIFAWWIGNDLDVGTLSNLCGGYLPLYLHGGLEMILLDNNVGLALSNLWWWISTTIFAWWIGNDFDVEPYPICVVDIYHHICMVDWK